MDFPTFGDATGYIELGEACASAISSATGSMFDSCYSSLRPVGIIFYYAIPSILTDDPVHRSYILLLFNLLLLAMAFWALWRIFFVDPRLRSNGMALPSNLMKAVILFPLLLSLVSHLPVTLSDLPSLAFLMLATSEGTGILFEENSRTKLRKYFLTGLLVSISVLLKQSAMVYGIILIFCILLFDWKQSARFWPKIKCFSIFLLGMSPILIQFFLVYQHSGAFWLYEPDSNRAVDYNRLRPNIEHIAFSIPAQGAIMVKVAGNIDYLSFIAVKLFRALSGFEWAVYRGKIPAIPSVWTLSLFDYLKVYGFVALYGIFSLITLLKAPRSLKLLTLMAFLIALSNAFLFHVELRYYLFPRIILHVTILYWLVLAVRKYGKVIFCRSG